MTRLALVLAALALGLIGEAHAFGDCAREAYVDNFDERLEPGPCEELARFPLTGGGASGTLRVIKTAGSELADRDGMIAFAGETAGRLNAAMTLMGSLRLGEVTMLVSDLSPPPTEVEGDETIASAGRYGSECTVIFFLPAGGFDDSVVFNLGHELFHCIQYSTWGAAGSRGGDWWVEGSADYFAHLVIPGTSNSAGWVAEFDDASPTRPLTAMSYEAVVFFAWYGGRASPAGVKALLDAVARSGDGRAALEATIAQDDWLAFAADYVEGAITFPGGFPIGSSPVFDRAVPAKEVGRMDVRAGSLVLARRAVDFRQARFANSAEARSGAHVASNEPGVWAELPADVEADCDHPRTYFVVAMTAAAPGTDISFRFDVAEDYRDCPACSGVSTVRDRCLIGTWRETSNDFPAWLSGVTGGGMTVTSYSPGDRQATLRGDGGVNASMVGTSATVAAGDATGEIVYENVQAQAFWSASGGVLTLCGIISGGSATMTMTIAGETQTRAMTIPPTSPDLSFGYVCSGDQVTLQTPADAGGWTIELTRQR